MMIETMPRFWTFETLSGFYVSDLDNEFPDEFAGSLSAGLMLADHRNGMHTEFSPVECLACRESNAVLPQVSTEPAVLV